MRQREYFFQCDLFCAFFIGVEVYLLNLVRHIDKQTHTHTHTHTQTNGKTLKDEGSARRIGICTRTGNTTFTRDPAAFEPAIPVSERPQTCALDRVATGIGLRDYLGVDPSAVKMERSITIH